MRHKIGKKYLKIAMLLDFNLFYMLFVMEYSSCI